MFATAVVNPFLPTLALIIGLAIVARVLFRASTKRGEAETSERIHRVFSENFDQQPEAQAKGKKEKRSPLMDGLERRISNSRTLQDGEGKRFMDRLDEMLVLAGIREQYSPQRALAYAIMIWTIGVIVPGVLAVLGAVPALIFAVSDIFFSIYPFLKLRGMVRARQDNIAREVPFFIQQLHMALSGGMTTLDDAILHVAQTSEEDPYDSILAREFARAQTEQRIGGVSYADALRGVSQRTQVTSVHNLVEAIIQGRATGAPMTDVLAEYGQQARRLWVQDMRTFKARKEPLVTLSVIIAMFGALLMYAGALVVNMIMTMQGVGS